MKDQKELYNHLKLIKIGKCQNYWIMNRKKRMKEIKCQKVSKLIVECKEEVEKKRLEKIFAVERAKI